jgi:hypothetical protein
MPRPDPKQGNALERRTQAQEFSERDDDVMNDTARRSTIIGHSVMGQEPRARPLDREPRVIGLHQGQRTRPRQKAGHMTEGRQPFTAEIKMLAKGPSTYDPLENIIGVVAAGHLSGTVSAGRQIDKEALLIHGEAAPYSRIMPPPVTE